MFQVVLSIKPDQILDFQGWLNSLNQGASFEGVYNGLTHSDQYRKLETEIKDAGKTIGGKRLPRLVLLQLGYFF